MDTLSDIEEYQGASEQVDFKPRAEKMIKAPWQAEIVARDSLQARACISYLANLLYDDPAAPMREQRLFEDGGAIIARIADAASARSRVCRDLLEDWYSRCGGFRAAQELARGELVSDGAGI